MSTANIVIGVYSLASRELNWKRRCDLLTASMDSKEPLLRQMGSTSSLMDSAQFLWLRKVLLIPLSLLISLYLYSSLCFYSHLPFYSSLSLLPSQDSIKETSPFIVKIFLIF